MIDLSALRSTATGVLKGALEPLWAKLLLALVLIAPVAIGGWVMLEKARDDRLVENGQAIGEERAKRQGHEANLEQIGASNEARNQVDNDRGNARYDECLRNASSGTRANCTIFLNQ